MSPKHLAHPSPPQSAAYPTAHPGHTASPSLVTETLEASLSKELVLLKGPGHHRALTSQPCSHPSNACSADTSLQADLSDHCLFSLPFAHRNPCGHHGPQYQGHGEMP